MCSRRPRAPAAPPPPPPPPQPLVQPDQVAARTAGATPAQRRRGIPQSTLLTGAAGAENPLTGRATLLGG